MYYPTISLTHVSVRHTRLARPREEVASSGGRERAETVRYDRSVCALPYHAASEHQLSLTTTTHANAWHQPHSLGLADGDALVEALLVVEVLEGVEDGALLLACVDQEAVESAASVAAGSSSRGGGRAPGGRAASLGVLGRPEPPGAP